MLVILKCRSETCQFYSPHLPKDDQLTQNKTSPSITCKTKTPLNLPSSSPSPIPLLSHGAHLPDFFLTALLLNRFSVLLFSANANTLLPCNFVLIVLSTWSYHLQLSSGRDPLTSFRPLLLGEVVNDHLT